MESICYITAFYDLGRENWASYPRSSQDYINCFSRYIQFFNSDKEKHCHMILFIDKKHSNQLREMTRNTRITLIEIDREWMIENLPVWKKLPREEEIMNSQEFKTMLSHRLDHPETYVPEYTMINHCKIDLVNYVIKISSADFYVWTDFGYLVEPWLNRIPTRLMDPDFLNREKINFIQLNPIKKEDENPIFTVTKAPEKVMGGFFAGTPPLLKKYQQHYHQILQSFHDMNIVDDDQAIILQCYLQHPDLIHLHPINNWNSALTFCQRLQYDVSVIIPTYQRYESVQNSINSVLSQKNSSLLEIIVIDDCSIDERYKSLDEIYRYQENVKIIHLPENMRKKFNTKAAQGLTKNVGIDLATGKFIAFLDDDDLWIDPHKLYLQIQMMRKYNCELCTSNMIINTGKYFSEFKIGQEIENGVFKFNRKMIETTNYVNNSTCIISQNVAKKAGKIGTEYSEKLGAYEDWIYWLKCLQYTDGIYIHKPLVYYDMGHAGGSHYNR